MESRQLGQIAYGFGRIVRAALVQGASNDEDGEAAWGKDLMTSFNGLGHLVAVFLEPGPVSLVPEV